MRLKSTVAVLFEGTGCEKGLREAKNKTGKGMDADYKSSRVSKPVLISQYKCAVFGSCSLLQLWKEETALPSNVCES